MYRVIYCRKQLGGSRLRMGSDGCQYDWDIPLPPPPGRQARFNDSGLRKQNSHYCDYYRLINQGMHQHISVSTHINIIYVNTHIYNRPVKQGMHQHISVSTHINIIYVNTHIYNRPVKQGMHQHISVSTHINIIYVNAHIYNRPVKQGMHQHISVSTHINIIYANTHRRVGQAYGHLCEYWHLT